MHFCTIITPDYLPYAEAIAASLRNLAVDFTLHVLIAGDGEADGLHTSASEIAFHPMDDLCREGLGKELHRKYYLRGHKDAFRWSMKSVFLLRLLDRPDIDRVAFVDPDLAFYSDPGFLFENLKASDVLLTPHWRSHEPRRDPDNFAILQTNGLYNAGFVGVTKGAKLALTWWGETCLYQCKVNTQEGLFVDQAYLNMMPVYFEGVEIIRHRGCNVANWNLTDNRRLFIDGQVKINGVDPIVFIHFTGSTIRGILQGADPYLKSYLDQWLKWRGVGEEDCARYLIGSPRPRSRRRQLWRSLRSRISAPVRVVRRAFQ